MPEKITITDTSLRDGMHSISHQFTPAQMAKVAGALDKAKIDLIEVGHGDGLGGSSHQYGISKAHDLDYLKACSEVVKSAKLTVLLLPGIGTQQDLDDAIDAGAEAVRVATHCTEADIAEQHIGLGKRRGIFVVGFLMMAHLNSPAGLAEQARMMESFGADVVYVTDSAGALLPDGVRARVDALCNALTVPVGFHAHNNLGLAIGNSLAALETGATYIDGSLRGFGAGAGNTQTEVLVGVLKKAEYAVAAELYPAMEAAEILESVIEYTPHVDNASLMIGYAGVYSSFLRHVERAAERFSVDRRDLLVELGRRRTVGGQEDMIIDVAWEMSKQGERATSSRGPQIALDTTSMP